MNLFKIAEALERCVKLASGNYVDTETGEVIDTEAIESLEMERDAKIRNIACWIRNLDAEEKALAEQERIYRDRKNATHNKKEDLKEYLASFLAGKKWKNEEVNISWRKSEAVEVTDMKKLSSYYLRYREPEVNKTLLKADLKAGVKLEGAVLTEKNNIQIK
ncbi:MAG: siphovirus Gp157 family protein [Aeriscardovia sp.]|nr:siphovirus Gp157 family protein [Aeriscardovia sp.]